MNWFKLFEVVIKVGAVVAGTFVKNADSKKISDVVIAGAIAAVEGLANSNPDGSPASEPYAGPPVKINLPN